MATSKVREREGGLLEHPLPRNLAVIVGCDPNEVESIGLLLDLLGWYRIVVDTIDQVSCSDARLAFFDVDANAPAEIWEAVNRIGTSLLVIALIGHASRTSVFGNIRELDLQRLTRPVDLALVERAIECAT